MPERAAARSGARWPSRAPRPVASRRVRRACGSVNIFIGARPPRQWHAARASGEILDAPASFEHFDFTGPLLQEGSQFLFVPVARGGGVCRQLQATLAKLEEMPQQAQCIARRGQALSRTLDMGAIYDYMAGTLRAASSRQEDGVARRVVREEHSRQVTKHNFFTFVPPAKR